MSIFWITDLLRLLKYYKIRFSLALGVMIIGFCALTVFILLESCIKNHLKKSLVDMGQSEFVVHLLYKDMQEKNRLATHFSYPEVTHTLAKSYSTVSLQLEVLPYQQTFHSINWDNQRIDTSLVLSHPGLMSALGLVSFEGRLLTPFQPNQKTIVIGHDIAQKMKKKGYNPLEEMILIHQVYYQIIGVLSPMPENPLLDFNVNRSIFMDYSLMPLLGDDFFQTFYVKSNGALNDSKHEVKAWLKKHFQLVHVFIKDKAFFIHAMMQQINLSLNIFKWLGLLTLSMGAIILMVTLGFLVQDRIDEMGIRICLGALKKELMFMFIRESVTLCSIGALGGIALGMPIAHYVIHKFGIFPDFQFISLLSVFIFGIVSGLFVGVVPIIILARNSLVDLIG